MAKNDFLSGIELVNRLNQEFTKHEDIINSTADAIGRLQGEYKKLPSDYLKIQREVQATLKAQSLAEKALTSTLREKQKLEQDTIKTSKLKLQAEEAEAKAAEKRAAAEEKAAKKSIAESEKIIKQKEKEFAKFEKEFNKYEADLAKQAIAEEKAKQKKVQAILDESKAIQSLQKQKEKELADEARAAIALEKANNLYNKIQTKVNSLIGTYNNLAAKRELGLKLNTREEAQLLSLEKRLNKYQSVLIKVDEGINRHTRKVGNYATAFNPLNNAIGQFARELPAVASGGGIATLLLAWSNQFGALQDAINQTVAANRNLIAQGQPVKSVLSQIVSTVFSLNTALYLGIAAFTAYGPEIIDWASNLFKGSKAIDAVVESQKQLNDIRVSSAKSVVDERVQLEAWLKTAQDVNLSYKEREIAANNILKQYPFWFENLGKEAILNGNVADAVDKVNAALLARAKAAAATTKITENQGKIIDLEEKAIEIEGKLSAARQKAEDDYQKLLKRRNSRSDFPVTQSADSYRELTKLEENLAEIKKETNSLNEVNNRLTGYAIQQTKEQIGLDYQGAEAKKTQTEALKDYLASQYELIKLRLENEASAQQRILENQEINLEKREEAYRRYHVIQGELAQNALEEAKRINNLEASEAIASIKKRVKDGEITERNGNAVIYSIKEEARYKDLIAEENYAESIRQINISLVESMKGVYDQINFSKAQRLINIRDLELTTEYTDKIKDLVKSNKDYRDIQKAAKDFELGSREISKANAQLQIDQLEREIQLIKDTGVNNQALLVLEGQRALKKKELVNITKEEADAQAAALTKMQQATENYLNSFKSDAFSEFGFKSLQTLLQVDDQGKTTFQNLLAGANTAMEKFQVVFTSIASVAQDAFAFIRQSSRAASEAEYADAERTYQANSKFYGESTDAKKEFDRQYEDKKREIRRRELKAEKDAALFNASINTARAVVSALPNIPLSIAVGLLGAAQIAAIASREIPAYAEGTDFHPGGLMKVNDAKGSAFKELISEPGKKPYMLSGRNRIVDAPKGTKVLNAFDTMKELDNLLMVNDIAPFASTLHRNQFGGVHIEQSGGLTKEDALWAFKTALQGVPRQNTIIDKHGIQTFTSSAHGKTVNHNNRVEFKSKGI